MGRIILPIVRPPVLFARTNRVSIGPRKTLLVLHILLLINPPKFVRKLVLRSTNCPVLVL